MASTDEKDRGNRSRASATDELLALALAAGKTLAEAAAAAGISPRTASRRVADDAFCGKVRRLRMQLVQSIVHRLANNGSQAVDKLIELLSAKSEMVQLTAAKSIVDLALRGSDKFDQSELEAVMEQLHEQLQKLQAKLAQTRAEIKREILDEIENKNGNAPG